MKYRRKRLRNYIFVVDKFGPINVWSLQHYKKGYEDAYRLPTWTRKKFMKQFENLIPDLIQHDIYVTGWARYHTMNGAHRIIDNFKIDQVLKLSHA